MPAMASDAGLSIGFGTPWAAQIDFLLQKLNLPTERWDDIKRGAHDKAFIVAGAQKAELLDDFHKAMVTAAKGGGLEAWRKDFKAIVARHGWTGWTGEGTADGVAWRTKVIYQTNMATSYAAARYQQLTHPDSIKSMPFWRYVHSDLVMHPRPLHVAWNGLTLPHDHPFWQTHFPPNGWGCQCRIVGVTRGEAAKSSYTTPPDGWDAIDPKTGAQVGIDKGWDYAPGASVTKTFQSLIDDKLIKFDAPIGARMWEELKPVLLQEKAAEFSEWANAIRATGKTTGDYRVIGAIDSTVLKKAQPLNVTPASAEIVVRDEDVWHTFRGAKVGAMPWSWYVDLPLHLQTPRAVILDQTDASEPALLYVFDVPGNATGKMVLKLDYIVTARSPDGFKQKKPLNVLRTGRLVDVASMNQPGYTLLSGAL